MRSTVLALGVVLVAAWAAPARAVTLSDSPWAPSKVRLTQQGASARDGLRLMGEPAAPGGNKVQRDSGPFGSMDPSTKAIVAIATTVFFGFGIGHWVMGDPASSRFLLIDALLTGGMLVSFVLGIVGWALAFAAIASGSTALPAGAGIFAGAIVVGMILGVVLLGARIWQIIDCVMKATQLSNAQRTPSAILAPRGPALGAAGLEPAYANGGVWRF